MAADKRLPLLEGAKQALRKAFPDHWSFLLGELALYSFVILVLTGSYLAFFFKPSMADIRYEGSYTPLVGVLMSEAYASVLDISFDVRGGLLIRQIHHWAALVFVAAIGVHMLRNFFTGTFRRPRESNWVIGVTLFMAALLEGFCGYSLPDDLLSGTGLRTAQGIVLSIPVVGTYLALFVFGGQFPGHDIIERLYVVHVLFIPGILIALIGAHLSLVVYHKHSQWPGPGRTNRNVIGKPFFPQYTTKSTGLFLMLFGVLAAMGALMQINPVWDFGPYRPDQASTDAQPDWYVGFLEGALRLMPAAETNIGGHTLAWDVLLPGAVLPTALFAVLYAYPFFERWAAGGGTEFHLCDRPRNQPARTALGAAGITFYTVLLLAGGQDVIAYIFRLPLPALTYGFRTALILLPLIAFQLTKRACLGLQAQDRARLKDGDDTGGVHRSPEGGYEMEREPLSPGAGRKMLVRGRPSPLPGTAPHKARRRRRRLREKVHSWYFRDTINMPLTEEQDSRISEILEDPAEAQRREQQPAATR